MPSWIVDDPTTLCFALGIAAFILGVLWWMSRRPRYLAGAGIMALAIGAVLLLYSLIDTDAKRIQRSIQEMADGVAARNVGQVFDHISDSFAIGNTNKEMFRRRVERPIMDGEAGGLSIWDFEPKEISRPTRTATVYFSAKAHGRASHEFEFYRVKARFRLEADGIWRLQAFELFPPHIDPESGQSIPLPF